MCTYFDNLRLLLLSALVPDAPATAIARSRLVALVSFATTSSSVGTRPCALRLARPSEGQGAWAAVARASVQGASYLAVFSLLVPPSIPLFLI